MVLLSPFCVAVAGKLFFFIPNSLLGFPLTFLDLWSVNCHVEEVIFKIVRDVRDRKKPHPPPTLDTNSSILEEAYNISSSPV